MITPDINQIYILNPFYRLKKDKNRILFISRDTDPTQESINCFIHPVYAIVLSFFNGQFSLNETLNRIERAIKLDREILINMIFPLIENTEDQYFQFDGYSLYLPQKVIIKQNSKTDYYNYDPELFFIPKDELDMNTWRFNSPLDAIFVVHTRCLTDCVYCYADRRTITDCQIPIKRIKEIFREANSLGMRSIDLTGGDFFLFSDWEEILTELIQSGFQPYISTKYPIDSYTIQKLKNLNVKKIQISLDTIVEDEIKKILNIKDGYLMKIIKTLKELDENDFNIYINSQILSINQDSIYKLVEFLLSFKNIKRINIGPIGFSLYKGIENYMRLKPDLNKIKELEAWVDDLKINLNNRLSINFSGYNEKSTQGKENEKEKRKKFYKRSRCTANFTSFIILPDGKVTICEELYWHPKFIIGDLKKQSIKEVWNSEKAFKIYNITKEMTRVESNCHTCIEFNDCHQMKGVCWKEVLYAYGLENWDYPDPKCPFAPLPFNEYYIT